MAGKISEYPAKTTFDDTDLYDCSTTGTVSEKVTYSQIKDDLKNTFHTQGGNSYGTDLTIGTNDANDVVIEAGGSEAIRINQADDRNVEFANGIQTGNVIGKDVFFEIHHLTDRQILALDTVVTGSLTIAFADFLSATVMLQGTDGRWYLPNDQRTGKTYEVDFRDSAGTTFMSWEVPSGGVFDTSSLLRISVTAITAGLG